MCRGALFELFQCVHFTSRQGSLQIPLAQRATRRNGVNNSAKRNALGINARSHLSSLESLAAPLPYARQSNTTELHFLYLFSPTLELFFF